MSNDNKYVVLVADDEPSTLALLSRHLRSKGYTLLEAADGDEAWELAHEHLPHLVLLDVMMPGMSGWEVCRKIREAVSLAHTGVIMLTGIGETLNEMTSPLYGADAHVDKPFEFAVLDRAITETLERRRAGALGRADSGVTEEGTLTFAKAPSSAGTRDARRAAETKSANRPKPLVKVKAAPKAKPAPVPKAKPAPVPKAKPAPAPKAKPAPAPKAKPVPKAKPKPAAPKVTKKATKASGKGRAAKAAKRAPAKPAPKPRSAKLDKVAQARAGKAKKARAQAAKAAPVKSAPPKRGAKRPGSRRPK